MIRMFVFFALAVLSFNAHASDSLQVSFSKKVVKAGDTLEFDCLVPAFKERNLVNATLNLWIEDLDRKRRWKFRWPIVDRKVLGSLAITESIPEGRYAFNFLVQRGFFRIDGKVKDHFKKQTSINYLMVLKDKTGSYVDVANVADDGSFKLKNTLFQDSAYFIFTPVEKVKNNYLSIQIETPLDSSFVPDFQQTSFITVGDEKRAIGKKNDSAQYKFSTSDLSDPSLLPGVTVTTKYKTKLEQYDDMYSSGLFKSMDAITFDGLDNNDIANSPTLMQYLQARIAGFTVKRNQSGEEVPYWRGERVQVFVDEFGLSTNDFNFIPTSEIAMVKAFRPPAMLSPLSGAAGAIVIYTKKGSFSTNGLNKHNFVVQGYSAIDAVWK